MGVKWVFFGKKVTKSEVLGCFLATKSEKSGKNRQKMAKSDEKRQKMAKKGKKTTKK